MKDSILHPTAEQLQSFVEGVFDGAELAVLETHLLGCTDCRGSVEEWRSLFSVLAVLPRYAPSRDFAARVMSHVTLPDPWYVRAGVRVGAQLQTILPKTTRGWAAATAFLALPFAIFGALAAWILSKPYVTPQGLVSFVFERSKAAIDSLAQGALSAVLHSDAALFAARGLEAGVNAGLGATGALAAAIAMATGLSVWVLYQNLFRTQRTRENNHYASYSF